MGRVDGKIAFVTGGANGMGRSHALLLAREGATLIVTDMDEKGGNAVVEEINDHGGQARFFRHDVSSVSDWERISQQAMSTFGRVDILVNNAGILVFLLCRIPRMKTSHVFSTSMLKAYSMAQNTYCPR